MIKTLTIEGFKSVRKLEDFPLYSLNILVGANGAGKSNFIGFLRLVREMAGENLQFAVNRQGRADAHLFLGPKHTEKIVGKIDFGTEAYEFCLDPTADNRLIFREERIRLIKEQTPVTRIIGTGHSESLLNKAGNPSLCKLITALTFYHFHDTGDTAAVRREHTVRDNEYLRPDAGNLAAFLYDLREKARSRYELIRDTLRLAAPFFDDFKLRPFATPDGDRMIGLDWTQKYTDYPFHISQLSDGTLRFVCLAAALLQPDPPPVMIFDEPELGLHPEALRILAGLFRQAAARIQIIAATQSASFLNDFEPEDVIVTDREQGATLFRRLSSEDLSQWLEEYSLGELWQKNIFEGGPVSETGSGAGRRTD